MWWTDQISTGSQTFWRRRKILQWYISSCKYTFILLFYLLFMEINNDSSLSLIAVIFRKVTPAIIGKIFHMFWSQHITFLQVIHSTHTRKIYSPKLLQEAQGLSSVFGFGLWPSLICFAQVVNGCVPPRLCRSSFSLGFPFKGCLCNVVIWHSENIYRC